MNMALLLRVVNESENLVVNQVVEEVNPPVEVGFDICGTSPEPDYSDNRGKPRVHFNLPYVLQIYIAFVFKYYIKWLGVEWKPNWCINNLVFPYQPCYKLQFEKYLVKFSHA